MYRVTQKVSYYCIVNKNEIKFANEATYSLNASAKPAPYYYELILIIKYVIDEIIYA